jgi:cell division protein FtsB
VTVAAPADGARPRPLRSLLSALFVFLLLVLATAALKGWRDLERARAREVALATEIAATERRIADLRRRIADIQGDPATLDRIARDELGLVHPDEVVVVVPAGPPAAPAAPETPETNGRNGGAKP